LRIGAAKGIRVVVLLGVLATDGKGMMFGVGIGILCLWWLVGWLVGWLLVGWLLIVVVVVVAVVPLLLRLSVCNVF